MAQSAAETVGEAEGRRPEEVVDVSERGGNSPQRPAATNAPRRKRPTRAGGGRDETLLAEDDLPRLSDLLNGSY